MYKPGYHYQKAGIILSKLKDADKNEVNLLTPLMDDRSKTLMKAIDHTNNKYGRHAITIASVGNTQRLENEKRTFIKNRYCFF